MPITTLNPNLLGTDSSGASKLSTTGGLVQLHSTGVFAIANNTANNLHIANTGLIGIGTIIPETFSARVAIASSNGTNESIPLTLVNANSSTNTAVSLGFAPNVNIDLARITALRTDTGGGGATDLQFKTYTGSSLTEKARVTANGNFGIANTAPANPLVVRSANAHIYLQQNNTDHGSILSGSTADGNFRIYRKDDSGTNERFSMATDGQMYHNASYLLGSSYNCYYAKMTTAVSVSTSYQDTGVVWTGVYIPTNVRKILLWYNAAIRNNGLNQCHIAFRVRVVNNATSGVSYVGNGSWGFGINAPIDSSKNHFNINQHINIFDYSTNGNQAGFAAGSTYTIYLQVSDATASGGNLKLGGDPTHLDYTPVHGTIWVI